MSRATVSNAYNRPDQLSERLRAKIMSAAERLGYQADPIARALASGRTGYVGVLCRSLELSWPTLDAILAVRAVKNGESYFSDPIIRAEYEATDVMTAQRAIRFLRVRQVAQARAGQGELRAGAA